MLRNKFFLVFFLAIFLSSVLAQPVSNVPQTGPLQGKMDIYKIVRVDGQYKRFTMTKAKPGDILEYVVSYKNTGNKPIKNIQIIGPIPAQSYVMPSSIKMPTAKPMMVSIDGGNTYNVPPMKRKVRQGNKIVEVVVSDKEWTHLKCTVPELAADKTTEMRYWVYVR